MAPAELGERSPGRPYRHLIRFWIVILALLGGGATVLQYLGPLPPHTRSTAVAVKPATTVPPTKSSQAATDQKRAPAQAHPTAASPATATALAAPASRVVADPDPALQEPAPDFPSRTLPHIGPGNRAPSAAYAALFNAADKHPRVALILDGLGLDEEQTLRALQDLPAEITVAFSAYMPEGEPAAAMAAAARRTGHECLLSIPMEPSSFPLSEEGARSLLTGADNEQNHQNLEWSLSRLPGCIGATGASDGLAGERFAQSGATFGDLLSQTAKMGLLYLDPHTGAPTLPAARNARIADLTIDQAPSPEQPATADAIDARLAALERLAAERGAAIGLAGPPRPVMLERIAVWAHGLAGRGIALAPLTAMPAPQ